MMGTIDLIQMGVAASALVYLIFTVFRVKFDNTEQKAAIATFSVVVLLVISTFLHDAWPVPVERVWQILIGVLVAGGAADMKNILARTSASLKPEQS